MELPHNLPRLCTLLERTQAGQNAALARTLAATEPESGAAVLEAPWGLGVFLGEGHPMNQGLALGLEARLGPSELDTLEAFLGRGGAPVVLELAAGAEADLPGILAARGYRVRQFQQVWVRSLEELPPIPAGLTLRPAAPEELELFSRLVGAGFSDADDWAAAPTVLPALEVPGTTAWLAFLDGVPAAGATLGLEGEGAALSGTAVLPRFRGRGLQRALVAARLEAARSQGACFAVSATLPWNASAANLARLGFGAAYPKVELEGPGGTIQASANYRPASAVSGTGAPRA